jgi:hypothetical protein
MSAKIAARRVALVTSSTIFSPPVVTSILSPYFFGLSFAALHFLLSDPGKPRNMGTRAEKCCAPDSGLCFPQTLNRQGRFVLLRLHKFMYALNTFNPF